MFQILKSGKTDAKIVQSQLAAERMDAIEQGFRMGQLVERSRFGNFQRELLRTDAVFAQQTLQQDRQFSGVETAGRQVDGELQSRPAGDQRDRVLQHPLVNFANESG
jgi:hypothetical protein